MTDDAKKSTRWSVTAFSPHTYAALDEILAALNQGSHDIIAELGWQDEICPETGRKHRQGYCRTVRQVRRKQLSTVIPGAHLEIARNWNQLKDTYCRKEETRDPSGSQVHVEAFSRPMRLHEMLIEVANCILIAHPPETKHSVDLDRQTDRQILLRYLRDFSFNLVMCHPEYGVVLSRQDARDAWCNYIEVWLQKAASAAREGQ